MQVFNIIVNFFNIYYDKSVFNSNGNLPKEKEY